MFKNLINTGENLVKYSGGLSLTNVITDNTNLKQPGDMFISRDGLYMYTALTSSDGIAWFSINQTTGYLTYVDRIVSTLLYDNATNACESPDGCHVYLASKGTNSVSWFTRNKLTGALTYVDQYSNATNIPSCSAVVCSRDGRHVYACTESANQKIAYFTRNVDTGALTYVGNYDDAKYKGGQTLVMSQDDAFVYMACSAVDSVNVFARTSATGELTYVSQLKDNTNLDGARHIALSPDGLFAYISSYLADSLTVCSVNTATGALTVIQTITSSTYIDYIYNTCVTHDIVYATARENNAFAVFQRDATTGLLTYKHSITDPSITLARYIAVTPDNRFAVATAITTSTYYGFKRMVEA